MHVCVCIVMKKTKNVDKEKRIVTLGEEKKSQETKRNFIGLQLNVSHLVDGLKTGAFLDQRSHGFLVPELARAHQQCFTGLQASTREVRENNTMCECLPVCSSGLD